MHAPGAVCRQLYRIHPQLRLGWDGTRNSFALIQLYHVSDAKRDADGSGTFFALWEDGDTYYGPIFDKDGGGTLDYDPLTRIPIYKACFADYDITISDVLSGAFLETVRRWLIPNKIRRREEIREQRSDLKRRISDQSGEMTDFLWSKANETGQTSPIIPWEFRREETYKFYEEKEKNEQELYDYYAKEPGL